MAFVIPSFLQRLLAKKIEKDEGSVTRFRARNEDQQSYKSCKATEIIYELVKLYRQVIETGTG